MGEWLFAYSYILGGDKEILNALLYKYGNSYKCIVTLDLLTIRAIVFLDLYGNQPKVQS